MLGIPESAVRLALDPSANIASRTVTGGPAPDAVAAMVAAREADLAREMAGVEVVRGRIAAATQALQTRAEQAAAAHVAT